MSVITMSACSCAPSAAARRRCRPGRRPRSPPSSRMRTRPSRSRTESSATTTRTGSPQQIVVPPPAGWSRRGVRRAPRPGRRDRAALTRRSCSAPPTPSSATSIDDRPVLAGSTRDLEALAPARAWPRSRAPRRRGSRRLPRPAPAAARPAPTRLTGTGLRAASALERARRGRARSGSPGGCRGRARAARRARGRAPPSRRRRAPRTCVRARPAPGSRRGRGRTRARAAAAGRRRAGCARAGAAPRRRPRRSGPARRAARRPWPAARPAAARSQRQRRRRARRRHQLRLLVERGVVDQRRDRPPPRSTRVTGPARSRPRQLDRAAFGVDVAGRCRAASRRARATGRRAHAPGCRAAGRAGAPAQLDDQLGDAEPRQPAAQQPGEEGQRHQPEGRDLRQVQLDRAGRAQLVSDDRRAGQRQRQRTGRQHRGDRPAKRRRAAPQPQARASTSAAATIAKPEPALRPQQLASRYPASPWISTQVRRHRRERQRHELPDDHVDVQARRPAPAPAVNAAARPGRPAPSA